MNDLEKNILRSQKLYYDARRAFDMGELDRALERLMEAWALHETPGTAYWIGECRRYGRDLIEAEGWLRRAFRAQATHPTYSVGYGRVLLEMGRFVEAEAVAAVALEHNPDFEPARKLLALAHKGRVAG